MSSPLDSRFLRLGLWWFECFSRAAAHQLTTIQFRGCKAAYSWSRSTVSYYSDSPHTLTQRYKAAHKPPLRRVLLPNNTSMASLLQLPRELYLMVANLLAPVELTKLAGVSRDNYLAAQQPLYTNIRLTSYSSLVKLVGTLMKVPMVSHISAK